VDGCKPLAVGAAFWVGGLLVPLATGNWGMLWQFATQAGAYTRLHFSST